MKNIEWCSRNLIVSSYYYALCTNEKQFYKELKKFKITPQEIGYWIKEDSSATTHFIKSKDGKRAGIVCIDPKEASNYEGIQIAALLVHEAVHIWQEFHKSIGELQPSSEFEAYSIQMFAQELMYSYYKQIIKPQNKKKSKKKS